MNEVKLLMFRAWDAVHKEMVYFDFYGVDDGCCFAGEHILTLDKVPVMQRIPELLNEIYVGDIVKEDYFIGCFKEDTTNRIRAISSRYEPTPINGHWKTEKRESVLEVKSLRQIYEYLKAIEDICATDYDTEKCRNGSMLKVIGNKYENPELLNA